MAEATQKYRLLLFGRTTVELTFSNLGPGPNNTKYKDAVLRCQSATCCSSACDTRTAISAAFR